MRRLTFVASLLVLMAASALLGWRANVTLDPPTIRDIPIRVPDRWYVRLV
jgi:hypothetical protein